MPRLSNPRAGIAVEINAQSVRFSMWPATKKGNRFLPQAELLTKNPWEAIENAINARLDRRSKALEVCLSFLYQALDFYRAYENSRVSSKPLLLYYSFLNLAKALIVCERSPLDLGNATHGLSENRKTYNDSIITARQDGRNNKQIYDLLSQKLGLPALTQDLHFNLLKTLLPQIVIGHRLWVHASNKRERFIRVENFKYLHQPNDRTAWLDIEVKKSDLETVKFSPSKLLSSSFLTAAFRQVRPPDQDNVVRFEQRQPNTYVDHPAEVLNQISRGLRSRVWCIMRTVPPYRRYYLWAGSPNFGLIDPLLSVYLVVFYLGSVTRYRPYYFEQLQSSPYGNFFDEIVQTQGQQMLFHLAAEFQQRDVSWPAVL